MARTHSWRWPAAAVVACLVTAALVTFGALRAESAENLVPNGSLEVVSGTDPDLPESWSALRWGTNSAFFEYLEEGRTGSRSVMVTVTDHESGDARWVFDPQPLEPDRWYRFGVYYRTDAEPRAVAMFVREDDSVFYRGMPDPHPADTADWQHYECTFVMPADARDATLFLLLGENGWLQTDDYYLETYEPVGFDRPLVSLTFDDGIEENVTNLLPRLGVLGMKATMFLATQFFEGNPVQEANILAFSEAGHEIGSHSVTHPFLTKVAPDVLEYELTHSKEFLEGLIGKTVFSFAAPYGDYNRAVNDAVRVHYRSHRTVDEGYNSRDGLDRYRIRVQNLHVDTPLSEFQSWLDRAAADGTWLVLVYHRITDNAPGTYDTWIDDFDEQMAALVSSGIDVVTVNEAVSELLGPRVDGIEPPRALAGETVTVSGANFAGERGESRVSFKGADAVSYAEWSDDEIKVVVPAGAKSGPVTVTTPVGVSNSAPFELLYPPPTVTSIDPASGSGTVQVKNLAGTGFRDGAKVTLTRPGQAPVAAVNVRTVSASRITCRLEMDGRAAGKWSVVVTNPDSGRGTLPDGFTVTEKPEPEPEAYPDWYLAEGTCAWGFATYVTVMNPNAEAVTADIEYMTGEGEVDGGTFILPAASQTTIANDAIEASLGGVRDFSTRVRCREGRTIAVERTMTWTGAGALSGEGHTSVGVTGPSATWYLPEGSSKHGFETWLLVQNPGAGEASVTLTYMTEDAGPKVLEESIPARSRRTFSMEEQIGAHDSSIEVRSDVPVIAERSMYRNSRRGGSCSTGAVEPGESFFLAEGTTAWGFTTYLLVQNPGETPAEVTVTYITPEGPREQPGFTMGPNSRKTVRVNDGLADSDCSIRVSASKPVVAERAMYWESGTGEAFHDSIGTGNPQYAYYLPDGQASGGRETFTLVQNPNPQAVPVRVTYLTPDGKDNVTFTDEVPPGTRRTYNMADGGVTSRASVMVEALGAAGPIVVERSMYWDGRGAGAVSMGGSSGRP